MTLPRVGLTFIGKVGWGAPAEAHARHTLGLSLFSFVEVADCATDITANLCRQPTLLGFIFGIRVNLHSAEVRGDEESTAQRAFVDTATFRESNFRRCCILGRTPDLCRS